MDPNPVVFDISSDEEGSGETRCGGSGSGSGCDDYDWISEFLEAGEGESDDSDDVVLVREVVPNPKPRLKSTVTVVKSTSTESDDECVVLDDDPDKDKTIAIENDRTGESDDLLIVGEKGQIACRDYPHSRHLCAKFPFGSTPHVSHCSQCHCYVCDSHAPCVYWGTGSSSIDHCHATDKEEIWRVQRKNFRQGEKAPSPALKLPDNPHSGGLFQTNQVPPLMQPNLSQNQFPRPSIIRACSTSTRPGIPNFFNPGRIRRPGYVMPRNKFQPHLVSQHLLNSRSHVIQKDRRHVVGNLGSQLISPGTVYKRTGFGVGPAAIRSGYCPPSNNYGSPCSRNHPVVSPANDKNPIVRQDFYNGMAISSAPCQSYSQLDTTGNMFPTIVAPQFQVRSPQIISSVIANTVPSQPQVAPSFRVLPPQNTGSVTPNMVPPQPQVASQPNMGGIFLNPGVPQPQASSHYNSDSIHVNSVPPQPKTSSPLNKRIIFSNTVSHPQESFQPNTNSVLSNSAPSLSQEYSRDISQPNVSQVGCQEGNQNQLDGNCSGYDSSWIAPPTQNNQQAPAGNSQSQSAEPSFDSPVVTELDTQFSGSMDPASLDFQFDDWFLDNHSVSGPSGLNVLSPEPAPIDTGLFFDF